jgi:hypothetical protein
MPHPRGEPLGPVLVVGLRRRSAIDRLGRLPETTRATVSVVTSIGDGPAPAGFAGWDEVDPEAEFHARLAAIAPDAGRRRVGMAGRLLTAARHPVATLRRRRLIARRAELAAGVRASAVVAAAVRLRAEAPVVALDADDVEVIRRARLASRLAPGILWWIADRDDEAVTAAAADAPAPR